MNHPIYSVNSVEFLGCYRLRVGFGDGTARDIDLEPILAGELYGPLRDRAMFNSVEVNPEVHTLVWPNGADFDPAILHDWPQHETAMRQLAQKFALAGV